MPQRKASNVDGGDSARIAPGTIVLFYRGLTEHRGRVVTHLPGLQGKPGTVVIKDTNGDRHTVNARNVIIAGGLTQQ